ncbi:MAG: hypothetical protein ND866_22920 [Pyrinomonadaceae bacterium]|nr:hypothetical protein [Pyrinomonadaceae bacterium]
MTSLAAFVEVFKGNPVLDYYYVPAFLEYPGSNSLRLETVRDLIVDICRSLARFGPRRFYVISTVIATLALKPAAETLAAEGILLHYLDPRVDERTIKPLLKQEGAGTQTRMKRRECFTWIPPRWICAKPSRITSLSLQAAPEYGLHATRKLQLAAKESIRQRDRGETRLWRRARKEG